MRAGFTLVELLVVISIIALIAAILLPVTSQAREKGRSATCQSNLHQITLATQQYLQDYDGQFPSAEWTPNPYFFPQALDAYLKATQVFRCSSQPEDAPYHKKGEANVTDYDFNLSELATRLNTFNSNGEVILGIYQGKPEEDIPQTSTTVLFSESGWISYEGTNQRPVDHYMRASTVFFCSQNYYGSILHFNGGNYSFLDGHVKWMTPEQLAKNNCANRSN